ncbi:MAG: hypothetical protein CL866_08180 [Cycloclasticus sp.]|nr:hypothetical protein [Cycloclasticus sp.]MBG96821.1 hypothetical protein [Cycloclasticus sp.]HAI96788.1 hypothetical protein [Methylococcaceae bacterium]|tara:strand:+ start:2227 stop:4119 length:1893 start_codon:yes stop_codon:yes gene_type:complete
MKDTRLLASAALFRELYDNDKDIYDVISEFIRASILLNSNWSFNATECAHDLETTFGFQIPDAVINTCLRNRLKKNGELSLEKGMYSVTDKLDRGKSIQTEYDTTKDEYDEITRDLVKHVRKITLVEIDGAEEEKIISCFNEYLLDENVSSEYADYISHFLLSNQGNEDFKKKLNQIEEGLVLYAGIKYSGDLSTLGMWNGNLIVFLDTEHLFSATGLNGVLYKKIFDDFNALIKEVNANKRKSGTISLRYFDETNKEVESFFYAAEKIVENHKMVDPSKTAMRSIINGCKNKSDVLIKKANFLEDLRKLKIEREDSKNYYENTEYNIESSDIITKLHERFSADIEIEKYSRILKLFTKINNLRSGKNDVGVESIAAIFMTENHLTQAVAFSDEVYLGKYNVPFSTNIEFLTERLWFKLNKGFGKDKNTPSSFNVITKAKLVLSSQVSNAVSESYKDLKNKYEKGKINKEQAALLINELRNKISKPEDYTIDNIDDSIDFLSEDLIGDVLREKSILEKKSRDGDRAIEELRKIKRKQYSDAISPYKKTAIRQYCALFSIIYLAIPILILALLGYFYTDRDSTLSVIFGVVSLGGFLITIVKIKSVNHYIRMLVRKYYKNSLLRIKKELNN